MSQLTARREGRTWHVLLWMMQIVVALAYLAFGASKVGSAPEAVTFFDQIGWGDWFRYLIGGLEMAAAVGLLIPRMVRYAAAAMTVIIAEGIVAHAALGDANGAIFVLPLVLTAIITWRRWDRSPPVYTRPGWLPGRGLGVLLAVVVVFLGLFVVPAYVTLDPAQARIDVDEGVALHYPALVAHIVAGMVAMVAGLFQISPRMRRHHPAVHRISGRIYLTAVLLGAPAVAALIVVRAQSPGETTSVIVVGFSLLTILWVGTTVTGFRMARQHRYAEHRRMMVYSFALTLSIVWSRFAFVVAFAIPGLGTNWIDENTGWLWWVTSLLVAHWWLHRTAKRPLALPEHVLELADDRSGRREPVDLRL